MDHRRLAPSFAPLFALACAGVEPDATEVEAPLDGYVVLDDAAREAGWHVRVGGLCFPQSGVTPVSVPAEEWVLVGRGDAERWEGQLLHPTPGLLLSLRGAELDTEVIELVEPMLAEAPTEFEAITEESDTEVSD